MIALPKKTKRARAALLLAFIHAGSSNLVYAGTVAGFGGSTEITQILNNIQLGNQYAQQLQQFARQGLQYQAQLKNLMANPSSVMSSDAAVLVRNIGSIMSATNAMGGTMAQIDRNFATLFKSPIAGNYAASFTAWSNSSKSTLNGALLSAGMHRDQFASDTDALQALYNQSQATNGTLDSLQTLAQINVKQVQQTQALNDLIATQNIASSTYMATQNSQVQSGNDFNTAVQQGFAQKPTGAQPDTSTKTYSKWNLYPSK